MKIIITDSNFVGDEPERDILKAVGLRHTRYNCSTEEELIEAGRDADAALVQFAPVTRRVLEEWSNCKLIVRYGIGYDNIDVEAATEKGIIVCNVPSYCLDEVADHTCALILAGLRKLVQFNRFVLSGQWGVESIARPMPRFADSIVGLIGFGRIGARVAERLHPFQFRVVVFDPYLTADKAAKLGVEKLDDLSLLLRTADAVSLHAPLTDQNRHMIGKESLALMKTGALLVNTSRGGLVDTTALARALKNGVIGGAALDVFEQEPLPLQHPLRGCDNTILTPHAAYYSDSAITTLQQQAAEEIVRWVKGQPLLSKVN